MLFRTYLVDTFYFLFLYILILRGLRVRVREGYLKEKENFLILS